MTLDKKILRLRQVGKSNREIAQLVGLSHAQVCTIATRLIREGRLRDGRGRPPSPETLNAELAQKILHFRRSGKSNREIADLLDFTYGKIGAITARFVRQGLLADGRRGPRSTALANKKRRATIVRLTRQGATLQEIGQVLGVTRERVRQLRNAIEAKEGLINSERLTMPRIAALLNVGVHRIYVLRRQGVMPLVKRGQNSFLLLRRDLKKVKRLLERFSRRRCLNCGCEFEAQHLSNLTCSPECRKQWKQRRLQSLRSPADGGLVLGWLKRLWELLRDRPLAAQEEWLRHKEAVRRSGLSTNQLLWLRRRRIVRTQCPNGTHGYYSYAASEVDLAGQVWREENARRKNAARPDPFDKSASR